MKRGNSKLKSTKPLKRGGSIKSGKSIKKAGKKSKEWSVVRKEVLEYFESIGLPQVCELQYENCLGGMFLTLAHSKRRRKIENAEQLKELIYACSKCHELLDALPHNETEEIVKKIIAKRGK